MRQHKLKRGDTRPELETELDIPLSDSVDEVRLYLEHEDKGPLGSRIPTIVDSGKGIVSYQLDQEESSFEDRLLAEWVIYYDDEDQQTIPREGYIEIDLTEPLDRADEIETDFVYRPDVTLGEVDASKLKTPLAEIAEADIGKLLSQLSAGGHRITDVAEPLDPGDVITKEYHDVTVGGELDGASNPAVEDYDFNGHSATNVRRVGFRKSNERPSEDELSAGLYMLNGQVIIRTEE